MALLRFTRFSLLTALVAFTLLCVILAWAGSWWRAYSLERGAVLFLSSRYDASFDYDDTFVNGEMRVVDRSRFNEWIDETFGRECRSNVIAVHIRESVLNDPLVARHVDNLPHTATLVVSCPPGRAREVERNLSDRFPKRPVVVHDDWIWE